jgi:hypothetical protein
MRTIERLRKDKNRCTDSRSPRTHAFIFLFLCLIALTTACGTNLPNVSKPASGANAAEQLQISIHSGPGSVGVPYNAVSSVSGGSAPYIFRISSGSLPPGLTLNSSTGSITGTPSIAGAYNFVISASTFSESGYVLIRVSSTTGPTRIETGSSAAQIVVAAGGSVPKLLISPNGTTIASQAREQFTAQISGTPNTGVTWSASVGTISSSGVFVAPKVTVNTSATITATSSANPKLQAAASLTVTPIALLAIVDSPLPIGTTNTSYTATLAGTGGTPPYQWSISNGTLPSGIQLQTGTGVINGMATLTGSYPFTANVSDASGYSASMAFTLTISSGSASGFDGPAELPRIYVQTAMANTPASGSTTTVNAGGNLQSALNSANCGDTIQLQAGATFLGAFTFPAKSCDDNHWIIVRTSAADSSLPAEGNRLTPCYAGVSSLPARPAFQCTSTKNVLPKLVMAAVGSGPIVFATGANHYRLIGIEVTRSAGTGVVSALASIVTGGIANNIVFDRVWMHGTSQDETTRGVNLGGSTYVSILDSFFTDFHCVSKTGSCTDSQAISGGLGSNPMGPYKITGNFLEAAGENILFGGGAATLSPADIEVSHNHMFKPLTWMKGQAGYVGATNGNPFIVKNLMELKNVQRVLIDSNIMEDSWGGFSQVGFAILLTPKNQAGSNNSNLCPICQVTDVTIRYTSISHVAMISMVSNTAVPVSLHRFPRVQAPRSCRK